MKFSLVAAVLCLAPLAQGSFREQRKGQLSQGHAQGHVQGHRSTNSRGKSSSLERRTSKGDENGWPIGTGDRFKKGKIPQGLGTQPFGAMLGKILNAEEIDSALRALANEYGFKLHSAPHKTYEQRQMNFGVIGDNPKVFFIGQIHAHNRGTADALIYFLGDLLLANKKKTGLTYAKRIYTHAQVEKALSVGIAFMPNANPDGVHYDQKTNDCWRRNRNPASAVPNDPDSIGVDVNRNFDVAWNYRTIFSSDIDPPAYDNSSYDEFQGKSPFSEQESKNIKWLIETFPSLGWLVNVKTFGKMLFSNWAIDTNQDYCPEMNFRNSKYDRMRGPAIDPKGQHYAEYLPPRDWADKTYVTTRVTEAATLSAGRLYLGGATALQNALSGTVEDWAYARHMINPAANKIHGFALQLGIDNELSCPFYQIKNEYHLNMLEAGAAMMEMLLAAAEVDSNYAK